jgi:hypothetical protein
MEDDTEINRVFVPWIETRYWDAIRMDRGGDILGSTLNLFDDLLSLTSLINNGTVVASADYVLLPRGDRPIDRIKLLNSAQWPFTAVTIEDSIAITGEWGFVVRPSLRWMNSGDTVQVNVNASSTTVKVKDIDGVDWRNYTPRFSPGQLLKIDDEFIQIRAVDTSATPDELTVRRGVNGSTAASHTSNTTIYSWNPNAIAERFATRAAVLQWQRRGNLQRKEVKGLGAEITYPELQTLPEYRNLLRLRREMRVRVG